jgi:hypothetical protein
MEELRNAMLQAMRGREERVEIGKAKLCVLSTCTNFFQVQLSVLKEEKRKMLLQLRFEEAERNKRNTVDDLSAVDISGKITGETRL